MFNQPFCPSLERVSDLINASLHTSILNQVGRGLTEVGELLIPVSGFLYRQWTPLIIANKSREVGCPSLLLLSCRVWQCTTSWPGKGCVHPWIISSGPLAGCEVREEAAQIPLQLLRCLQWVWALGRKPSTFRQPLDCSGLPWPLARLLSWLAREG